MSNKKTASNSFSVSTVEDGVTFRIGCTPSSVTIPTDASQTTVNLSLYFYIKEGRAAESAYSCYYGIFRKYGSTYTLLANGGKATYATRNGIVVKDNDTDAIVIRISDTPISSSSSSYVHEHTIIVNNNGNTGSGGRNYTIIVDSASASVGANGKLNANIVAHVVQSIGSSSSVYSSGLTCKIGKQTISPQPRSGDDPFTFIVTDGDWKNTSTYNRATVAELTFTLSSTVLATADVPISVTGQMSRNLYYAGSFDDVKNTQFIATDYSAPYVSDVPDGSSVNVDYGIYAYIGENDTVTFPSTYSGYQNQSQWYKMETNMKYLISEAIFSNFAKLGSAIFNLDFMFSQHGVLRDATNETEDSDDYRYIDPEDMMARNLTKYIDTGGTITVMNQSYDDNCKISLGTLEIGLSYKINVTVTATTTLNLKVATAVNTQKAAIQVTPPATNRTVTLTVEGTGDPYYLFYYKGSNGDASIKTVSVFRRKFRPNVYVDWLKGFLYAQRGYFQQVTVEGMVNNLITVIDWANNINRDKIILAKYDSGNFVGYYQSGDDLSTTTLRCYIDVLRCGDFIHIKSLPDEVRGEHCDGFVRLPYFITNKSDLQDRGHTRYGLEDNDTPHLMMPDELRRLVGRKFTFRISDMDTNWFRVQLLGGFHFSVYDSGNIALQNVGNGQNMYLLPQKSQGVYPEETSFRMSIPSTLHFEFRQCEFWHLDTTQNAYIGGDYGYAWTCSMNLPQSFSGNEYIDEEWT